MAAITYAIQTIAEAGDNIISASQLYGGTYNLFAHTLPLSGIETRFADGRDPARLRRPGERRAPRRIFAESVGNPLGNIVDIAAIAEVAHNHGDPADRRQHRAVALPVPALLNTAPTSSCTRCTKYLGGHGNSVGGAIVDSGKFPWAEHKARFKRLNEPDVTYHGVVYTEALGAAAYIGRAAWCRCAIPARRCRRSMPS
ncbi:PLP-dependent transferase [Cupriavidus basilensis]